MLHPPVHVDTQPTLQTAPQPVHRVSQVPVHPVHPLEQPPEHVPLQLLLHIDAQAPQPEELFELVYDDVGVLLLVLLLD